MSAELAFGLVGAVLTFFGIIVGVLIGLDAIRKKPIIGLGVAATIGGGGVLLLLAILSQITPLVAEGFNPAPTSPLEETSAISLTETAIVATQTALEDELAQAQTSDETQPPPTILEQAQTPATTPRTGFPQRFLSETGIPPGTTLTIEVDPETLHVVTAGPACLEGICVPGGEQRGSVIILLPRDEPYTLTNLVPTQNWHGAYHGSPEQWEILAEDRVAAMHMANNCTGGNPCAIVDVLVVGPEGVVSQYIDQ
jgi:hypothetical protein